MLNELINQSYNARPQSYLAMATVMNDKRLYRHYCDNKSICHPITSRNRLKRQFAVLLSLVFLLWLSLNYLSYQRCEISPEAGRTPWVHSVSDPKSPTNKSVLVPLEAHIMSKCPDAKDCLRGLVVPAMEKIVDMVDFNLSFIGTYVPYLSAPVILCC